MCFLRLSPGGEGWSGRPFLIGGAALQRRSPFGNGVIEQFKDQPEYSQVLLFDCSIIVALESLSDDRVDFALQGQQILFRSGISNPRDYGKNPIAVSGAVIPFVTV